MEFILSLAHFCEVHGPTSMLATQALEHACAVCPSASQPPSLSASISRSSTSSAPSSFPSDFFSSSGSIPYHASPSSRTPLSTPPTTPPAEYSHNAFPPSGLAKFRRACDASFEADTEPCVNCSMTLSKESIARAAQSCAEASSKSAAQSRRDTTASPILRTQGTVVAGQATGRRPTASMASIRDTGAVSHGTPASGLANPIPVPGRQRRPSMTDARQNASLPGAHTHKLTYTTAQQPPSPMIYSILRHSCLRSLSYETLPRMSAAGPLFFGDDSTGFTIAFIFRVPDPTARGHRRTYALLALGGRDPQRVMSAMARVTKTFAGIANWIVGLSEAVLDTENHEQRARDPAGTKGLTPTSSFLCPKKVDPDGHPRSPCSDGVTRSSMRGRSLSQIVGRDSIFVEMHVLFVRLLVELGKDFGIAK